MIIPSIDLRPKLLPIRHQGRRQSCLAFASSTAHEHQAGHGEHLSVEYLYYHAVARTPGNNARLGTTMAAAAAALAKEGQPVESAWPYSPIHVVPWVLPKISGTLHKTIMQPNVLNFDGVVAALEQGRSVILGIIITDAFYRPDAEGMVQDRSPDTERGGHAVVAVGHGGSSAGERALLIRNSWGNGWGLGGYGWLPYFYVQRQLHETALLI